MKTTVKKALSVMFMLSLMLAVLLPGLAVPVRAAGEETIAVVWAVNSDNSVVSTSDGIVVADGKDMVFVYGDNDFYEKYKNGNTFYVKVAEGSGYRLEWKGLAAGDHKLCKYSTGTPDSGVLILDPAEGKAGKAEFHCFKMNGDTAYQDSCTVEITGGADKNGWTDLNVTVPSGYGTVVNNNTENLAVGALLNEDGDLIGIYTPTGKFVALDELGGFADGGAPAPAGRPDEPAETEPKPAETTAPSDTQAPAETTGTPAQTDGPAPTEGGTEETDAPTTTGDESWLEELFNDLSWTVVAIVAGVALLLIAVVMVVVIMKRKDNGNNNDMLDGMGYGGGKTTVGMPPEGAYPPPPPPTPLPPVAPPPVAPPPVAPPPVVPPVAPPPPRSSGALYIYGIGGALNGQRYQISTSDITFGRERDNTICFPSETKGVSRHHCKLFWHKGVLMLMDQGSTYGTFFHGKGQLPANKPVPIQVGDTFYLGEKKNGFNIRDN